MAHSDWLDPNATAAAACPAPMTRAALLALRAAAALRPECPYIVNDHVQNRLPAGTNIVLRAVGVNELSEQVEVNTVYDNESWAGIYDLDRGLVLELTDNRGNVAKGFNGIEVANFDWGNSAYTNVTVEQATLTVTYGAPALITNVEVKNQAILNLTGFTGAMNNVRVHTVVTVNLTNANGTWRYGEWKNTGTFNATGYSGGGDNYYFEFDNCTVSLVGQTGQVNFRTSEFQNCGFAFAGTQTVLLQQSQLYSQTINRPAGGGPLAMNLCASQQTGSMTLTGAGATSLTGSTVNGNVSCTSTGALTVNHSQVGPSSGVTNNGTANMALTRVGISGASSVLADAGSSTAVNVSDTDLSGNATIRVIGAVGGGALNVTSTTVESSSVIYKRHTGALSITQSHLQGASRIDAQSGTRSYNLARCVGFEVALFTFTGTGAVTDNLGDIDIRARGQLNISCSGAANSIQYSMVSGLSGSLNFTGTTGGQNANQLNARDGSISFTNCTVNISAVLCCAENGGSITFTGIAAPKSVQYLTARTNGTITINNSTGGGTITRVDVSNAGQYVVSGAAGAATYVTAQQGTVSHNGGSLTLCEKRQGGTLTTGNFNHNGIIHASNVNTTLTAANTARALYMGLGPAAYAPGGILV